MNTLNIAGKATLLFALLATASLSAHGASAGSSGADILRMSIGTRAIGMGEAFTAMSDDVSSLYWNPAGLAFMSEGQASFSYNQGVQNVTFQNASVGIPLENGAIGANLSYLGYGKIPGYDMNGAAIGNQNANAEAVTVGGSIFGPMSAIGVNIKGINESLAGTSAMDAAADVGATLVVPRPVLDGTLRFAAVLQNVGPGMKFISQSDPLPTEWKVGAALVQLMDKRLSVSADLGKPRDTSYTESAGLEYWLSPHLALRTGYMNSQFEGNGLRAGIGLRVGNFSFDYAYANLGELGMINRYELNLRFGEPRPVLNYEERRLLKRAKIALAKHEYDTAILLFNSLIDLEPHYRPAQRLIRVAMARAEALPKETPYDGRSFASHHKAEPLNDPDSEEVTRLLEESETQTAATPTPPAAPSKEVKQ